MPWWTYPISYLLGMLGMAYYCGRTNVSTGEGAIPLIVFWLPVMVLFLIAWPFMVLYDRGGLDRKRKGR